VRQNLTPRQLEILALYAQGLRGREIAAELYIEPGTVKCHVQLLTRRLGTKSIAHAISVAVARGELVVDVERDCVRPPSTNTS
jgi:DNA-binding NarL/FixJ family response regulator